jgi:hypothetical protein
MRDLDIRRAVIDKAWKVANQALDGGIALANKDKVTLSQSIVVKDMVSKESVDSRVEISDSDRAILAKYMGESRIGSN